ncbi:MAG: MBL fold metallo-hydrolase [Candidatus Cloacimonetes bacterium 4572_65]|nr:MAG: MBL fold metallo-hydrolase [Candidatus Cloacimonetes bacterium 4572_65]
MLKTSVLLSGSKGNATLVCTENSHILVDAGLSAKKIFAAMEQINYSPQSLDAIVISHEHGDHVKGAGIISRKLGIPIYFTHDTYRCCKSKLGVLKVEPIYFEVGDKFPIGDIEVTSFSSSHDAIDSSNFTFSEKGNEKQLLAFATDLGFASKLLLNKISKATTIILESNHDEVLLVEGPYPWELKQRVKSIVGHLSNKQAVAIISQVIHPKLNNLLLAHLSETNNRPELAESEMQNYLTEIKHPVKLYIAGQYKPTPIVIV